MACLVTEDGHALGPGAALDLKHHFLLELHQAGMGEIERNRNAGHVCRAEPFARYPCVRPQPDAPHLQLFIQSANTILEPGAFDRNPQTAEALLEQLLIRQLFPSKFSTWHRYPEAIKKTVPGWCHRMLSATTAKSSRRPVFCERALLDTEPQRK